MEIFGLMPQDRRLCCAYPFFYMQKKKKEKKKKKKKKKKLIATLDFKCQNSSTQIPQKPLIHVLVSTVNSTPSFFQTSSTSTDGRSIPATTPSGRLSTCGIGPPQIKNGTTPAK